MQGDRLAQALTVAFVLLYLAAYLVYLVPSLNKPDPSVFGMSVTLVYSIVVWLLLLLVIVLAAARVWR